MRPYLEHNRPLRWTLLALVMCMLGHCGLDTIGAERDKWALEAAAQMAESKGIIIRCNTPSDCTEPTPPCQRWSCFDHLCTAGPLDDTEVAACTPSEPCQAEGICTAGVCKPTHERSCDDGNMCTADVCDKGKGCRWLYSDTSCDDGDPCTEGDLCDQGSCKPGPANPCGK